MPHEQRLSFIVCKTATLERNKVVNKFSFELFELQKNNNDNEDIYMKHKLHIFPCNTCSYYLAINKSKLYPCQCIFIRHTFSRFNIKLQPFCLVIFCLYFALRCKREKLWAYTPNKICQSQPSGNFCAFRRRNCFSL